MIYIDDNGNLNLSKLHPNQKAFIKSKYLHTGIVGGYQSGKSTVAVIKTITHLLQYPGVPIAYYLPTYGLFEDMLIPKVNELFKELNIKYTHNQKHSKIITPYGEIWMRSMDNPDRIVSYSVGYSVVDEVDVVHPNKRDDAMKRIASRNSFKKATANQIDFVSTPEGFAYMYKFFEKNANKNKLLLRLSTLSNEENLAGGYIQGLREQYTEDQLKAYLNGEFVNLTSGTVYYKFDRETNHSDRIAKLNETLFVGMDFNIGNMSAIIHAVDEIPIAVDELTGVYDTAQMCNVLKSKYPNNKLIIYPDASGRNRKTNASLTDIEIIKESGYMVKAKDVNPLVDDRVKNMNRMFFNGAKRVGYKVNTIKCPEYTEALERMAYDKNGQPDKSSGFDHVTDAGGYFIYYEYPLKTKPKFTAKKR
jgi:phage terminase large subunit